MLLTKEDLRTKSPVEIVNAIAKFDDTTIETIIGEAEGEMKAHMAGYDVNTIFSPAGLALPGIKPVLKYLKSLVIQELFRLSGSERGEKQGDDAIIFLEKVHNNKVTLDLPLAPAAGEEESGYTAYMGSKPYYETDF